jgi:hypothetical protein
VKRFLTAREDDKVKVFENRVLRRRSGPNREEVAGGWRRLYMSNVIICIIYKISYN